MKKKRSNRHWPSEKSKAAYQERMIAAAHERRANNAAMQAKIDAQAYELIAERKRILGANWRENCAIRIPFGYVDTD